MTRRLWLLVLGLGTALSAPAKAQSGGGLEALLGTSIVSTPSKGSETDTTAPATSTVITAAQLRQHGIRSLDEAINYLSLGMATSSSLHTAEIGARGVQISGDYGNHVLLLIDGQPQNDPWNGTAYFERGAGVPFEMIDHVEVMLGPGSVLYGSQAMLGVINIVTKRAKDFSGARVIGELETSLPSDNDGNLRSPGSSGYFGDMGSGYRLGAGYGREFQIGRTPSELTFGIEYYRSEGPTWQMGPQNYGDDYITLEPKDFGPDAVPGVWGGELDDADTIETPSAYLRFKTGDFQLGLRGSVFRRSTPYPDSLAGYAADFDDPWNHETDRFLYLNLSQRFPLSASVDLLVRGFGDLYDYRWYNRNTAPEDCPDGFLGGCSRHLKGIGRQGGGEARVQFQWPVLRAVTLLGVEARVRDAEDSTTTIERNGDGYNPAVGRHRTDSLIASYAAQSFSPTAWLDVNLGLRFDHDTRGGDELSPRTALGVTPWEGGRLKLIYAEAFRAPSAYELTYYDPNSQVSAPDLGPETVRSIEGSVEQRFGTHRLLFGVFRSWWDDLVGSRHLSDEELQAAIDSGELAMGSVIAYQRTNLGQIDNYGFNAAYEGSSLQGRLRFGLNLTEALAKVDYKDGSGDLNMTVAPQTFGNARLSYDLIEPLPTLGLALRFTDTRLATRAYDGGFPRKPTVAPVLGMRLAVTGPVAPLRGLKYRFGADYSFSKEEPYVIGAAIYANDNVTTPEFAPVRRTQLFVGLEYELEPKPENQ